jgi:hypothetical protein
MAHKAVAESTVLMWHNHSRVGGLSIGRRHSYIKDNHTVKETTQCADENCLVLRVGAEHVEGEMLVCKGPACGLQVSLS